MADRARAIENLLHTSAERIDAGDLEGVADLFAHGRIVASAEARPEQIFEGRDRVLALYRGSTRIHDGGIPRTKHVTTNSIIEVDDHDPGVEPPASFDAMKGVVVSPTDDGLER